METNEHIHIFDLQSNRELATQPQSDMWHGNDIEPLTEDRVSSFAGFEAGDLLISFRTQNLVFVVDPDTLKIKWWRIGAWDRQHDPDWDPNGRITVFSNNNVSPRQYSDVISIDPSTYSFEVLVNGKDYDLYSKANARHELTEFGTRMIVSTRQGWVVEVSDTGEVVSSFVNNYSAADSRALFISQAVRVPETYFERPFWQPSIP